MPESRDELVKKIAGMLYEWEDSGEIAEVFADRLIKVITSPDSGFDDAPIAVGHVSVSKSLFRKGLSG